MDIQAKKLDLIEWINQINDVSIIDEVKSIIKEKFENKEADFWDELSEDDKKSIAIGLQEVKDGKTRPYEGFIETTNQNSATEDLDWNNLSDETKKSIERGMKDVEEGRTVSYEEFRKSYEKYLQ